VSNPERKGKLLVVATPIGNLEDISPRALDVLSKADAVYCEDTRRTSNLFVRHGIATPRISCHEHNEYRRRGEILARLEAGESVALVSDAGTPLISDPGERVVSAAIGAGYTVEPVPGPSAITALLSVCGFPCVPFSFLGFPPPRRGERDRWYASYALRAETRVLFESPFRIVESLKALSAGWSDPLVAVGRELTKVHEEVLRGRSSSVSETLAARTSIKGEFVIAAAPPDFPGFSAAP
jgi:16S rRNA (cytidine1402-2'-O)-methyltransferase